jgi:capsular polysaccharide transport system permease protein
MSVPGTELATPGSPLPQAVRRVGRWRVRKHLLLVVSVLVIALAMVYWGLLASDRFVSETHVVVDRTDLQPSTGMDFASLVTGGRSNHDMLLLRDHLRSIDILQKLESRLKLRAHYSDKQRDLLSRMWFRDASQEFFHQHYLSRTSIEVDELAGILRIRAQAYDAITAHAIASTLISEGEAFMNEMAHRLAREQVAFLEQQVSKSGDQALQARRSLIDYQNKTGLISPLAKAESLVAIAGRMEAQISELKARRAAMMGYLSPQAPDVAQLNLQIAALERQLVEDQGRLASPKGGILNKQVEEYQRLEFGATFAQDVYRTSLVALERGRVEAGRTLKKVSVVQSPTLAEYPLEPRRIYNVIVFALTVLALAGIAHLLAAIVRDHQD